MATTRPYYLKTYLNQSRIHTEHVCDRCRAGYTNGYAIVIDMTGGAWGKPCACGRRSVVVIGDFFEQSILVVQLLPLVMLLNLARKALAAKRATCNAPARASAQGELSTSAT